LWRFLQISQVPAARNKRPKGGSAHVSAFSRIFRPINAKAEPMPIKIKLCEPRDLAAIIKLNVVTKKIMASISLNIEV
jgi:hypothetical protein